MTVANSTRSRGSRKALRKPRPDFPLTPHPTGRWCKKVRGRLHYFGKIGDPDAALALWLAHKDDLLAGRTPRASKGAIELRDVLNHFLTAKRLQVDSGELTPRTWADYHATGERLAKDFRANRPVDDLYPDDFASYRAGIAKRWGPVALTNEIQRVRTIFKYAFEAGLIEKPLPFGPSFKRPSKKTLRLARAAKGSRMIEAADLRCIIDAAPQPLLTMILLALNAGLGNADCAALPLKAIHLDTGWVDFPRPKTGIPRRFKLWPETLEALGEWLRQRPEPKDDAYAKLVFVTRFRTSWDKSGGDGDNHANPIAWEMKRLLRKLQMYRPGIGFYALRHVFRTMADECRDQVAVDHVMGHARDDMASVYRERISDDRLQVVTNYVRTWLFDRN